MISYLNLNGLRTLLGKLREIFLTKAAAASTYLKKADLNFVTTSSGIEIRDSNGNVTYKIPIMKEG